MRKLKITDRAFLGSDYWRDPESVIVFHIIKVGKFDKLAGYREKSFACSGKDASGYEQIRGILLNPDETTLGLFLEALNEEIWHNLPRRRTITSESICQLCIKEVFEKNNEKNKTR